MISDITIENYKSIQKLTFKAGRITVFIGENGCGKSNILEAIGLAAAAQANKLDNEFLTSRGIRVTEPSLMRAGFDGEQSTLPIKMEFFFAGDTDPVSFDLNNDNQPYSVWKNPIFEKTIFLSERLAHFSKLTKNEFKGNWDFLNELSSEEYQFLLNILTESKNTEEQKKQDARFLLKEKLNSFLIFSPENTALRNFYKEGQIEPLGINGEGLLKLLKVFKQNTPEKLDIINEALKLFGWYQSVEIPATLNSQEDKIQIQDRFIAKTFDQRSANEGFLFVLFYIALMVSKDTPSIFAIDNIDASLNPKLCTQLIKLIAQLAEQFDKQVFLTTHNPAILDGLDLTDDNQKLLVISRNKKGHTRVNAIGLDNLPVAADGEAIKLSEAMLRGYIGGLPKGF